MSGDPLCCVLLWRLHRLGTFPLPCTPSHTHAPSATGSTAAAFEPRPPRSLVAGAKLNTLKVGLSNALGFFLYEYCKDVLQVDGRISPVEWSAWLSSVRWGAGWLRAQGPAGNVGGGQEK